MRIAAVHNYLGVRAGAAGAFIDMMSSLKKRGHDIEIYTFGASEDIRGSLGGDFRVLIEGTPECASSWLVLKPFTLYINYLRLYGPSKRLAREINGRSYDVAFLDHYLYTPMLMPHLRIPRAYYCYEPPRLAYEPSIVHGHTTRLSKFVNLPFRFIDKHLATYADLILCNSDYVGRYIEQVYQIDAVTNLLGVDTEKYRPLEVQKEDLVLCVGVIQPFKAQDFLIRSLGLISEFKRPRLVIITSGLIHDFWYRDMLLSLAQKLNVCVEIREKFISHEEFLLLHSTARLVAIPYIREPSIEPVALACGTPIVAVKEGGAPETIIDGKTGLLTERDEKQFAQAIEYLLDHPDVAEEMGRTGRQWVLDNFTWDKCAENLERNLLELLARKLR